MTGAHPGRWRTHGDQRGVSFVPERGFTAGETVTVTTPLSIAGAEGGTFRYMVARPGAVPAGSVPSLYLLSPARAAAQQRAAAGTPGAYRSRPDLKPPPITINTSTGRSALGLLFASSGVPTSVADAGVLIYDDRGQPVWFKTLPPNGLGTLTRISYRGRDAVTWFEGYSPWQGGFKGSWIVADSTYSKIGEVAAGNGYVADGHELEVDSQGTRALLDVYNPVATDLSRYGGSASATVLEAVVQEIDLATGAVTFEWHSLDQVPVDDTYESLQAPAGGGQQVVDYFHPNSLAFDSVGGILVNGRHISATVKLDRTATGGSGVRWRLGGKHSDFTFQAPDGSSDPSYAPSYPHDARRRPDGTLSVYDNGVQRTPRYGRGIAWRLDEAAHTARAAQVWNHGKTLFGLIVGSNRPQPNGDQLVSFGSSGDTVDRVGRFNHFTGGSMYWTPGTAAHEVHGAIRDHWAQLGWERSPLGYPRTDEYDIPTGRRNDFVHGGISWDRATGVVTVTG